MSFWSKIFGGESTVETYKEVPVGSAEWARIVSSGVTHEPVNIEDINDIIHCIGADANEGKTTCFFRNRRVSASEIRLLRDLGYRVNGSGDSVFIHWSDY